MLGGVNLLAGHAEATFAPGKRAQRQIELCMIEVRPQHRREIKLGVRQLPQKKVTDALLATGTDEQIRFRATVQTQARLKTFRRDVFRTYLAGQRPAREFGGGLGDVPTPAIIGGDRQRQRGIVLGQMFCLADARANLLPEAFDIADYLEAYTVLVQLLHLAIERREEQVHEQPHLLFRAPPVLARKRKQREVANTVIAAGLDQIAHPLHALTVAGDTRQPAPARPAAVAVHDDGNVSWHLPRTG